jgi:hypothetical protein
VLLATVSMLCFIRYVSVFCVISHEARVLCYQPSCSSPSPCLRVSVIVSEFVVFVSAIVSVVALFQPSFPCACSVFCFSAIMPMSVFCVT